MDMKDRRSDLLHDVKKVVVKVGSNCITSDFHIDEGKIGKLVDEIISLMRKKIKVVLVTSGAVAAGTGPMKLLKKQKSISEKQACAAVGQIILMEVYRKYFKKYDVLPAQILLTETDFTDRKRYLNIRNTIDTLLQNGVVPIINENDTVAVAEIVFGDNDMLSALMANVIEADLLLVLTTVDGLRNMTRNERIPSVEKIDESIYALVEATKSSAGRGGMTSKLQAMKTVTDSGRIGVIADFSKKNVLSSVLSGADIGTVFSPAVGDKSSVKRSREQWLKYGTVGKGKLVIDEGAVKALMNSKSLLPMGIVSATGKFDRLDIVDIHDVKDMRIARGVANYDINEILKIKKHKSSEIEAILGYSYGNEAVHVDNLVLLS